MKTLEESLNHVLFEAREEKVIEASTKDRSVYRTTAGKLIYTHKGKVGDVYEFLDTNEYRIAKNAKTADEFLRAVESNAYGYTGFKVTLDKLPKEAEKVKAPRFEVKAITGMRNERILIRTEMGTLLFKNGAGQPLSLKNVGLTDQELKDAENAKTEDEFLKIAKKSKYFTFNKVK